MESFKWNLVVTGRSWCLEICTDGFRYHHLQLMNLDHFGQIPVLIVSGQGFPMMMWRGSDVGLREILGLWQLKCAKLTVNSQFFGCVQKWIYPEENIFSAPRSYLPDYWKQLFQMVMVSWWCAESVQHQWVNFVLKKKSNSCGFGGFGGCNFPPKVEPQRHDVMKTCREWTPRVSIWHISFAWSQTCQWISRPGGRFRYLGILFTSLDAGS